MSDCLIYVWLSDRCLTDCLIWQVDKMLEESKNSKNEMSLTVLYVNEIALTVLYVSFMQERDGPDRLIWP